METNPMIARIVDALGLAEHQEHMDGIKPFARELAQRICDHEAGNPDPDELADAAALFLGLRLHWHDEPNDHTHRHETMAAIKDAYLCFGYDLGLDDCEFDMHTPDGEDMTLSDDVVEALETSGFYESADLGILEAALWHGFATNAVAGSLHTEDDLAPLLDRYRRALISRIVTGSFMLDDENSLHMLVLMATQTIGDLLKLTPSTQLMTVSNHLRDIFDIHDEAKSAQAMLPDIPDSGVGGQFLHAAVTIAAIAHADPGICLQYLTSFGYGSRTGLPFALSIEPLRAYVYETDEVVEPDDIENRDDLLHAITVVQAVMTLTGRIPPMDTLRTATVASMASEDLHQHLDVEGEDVALLLEKMEGALRDAAASIDDYLDFAAAADADENAEHVRHVMDTVDPTPPPTTDESVLPRAILVRTGEDAEIGQITHRIDAFLLTQRDSFRAFGQGDVYWRLSIEGWNSYGATVEGLRTIADLAGVEQASVIHRSEGGSLGVTTIRKGSTPIHRRIDEAGH